MSCAPYGQDLLPPLHNVPTVTREAPAGSDPVHAADWQLATGSWQLTTHYSLLTTHYSPLALPPPPGPGLASRAAYPGGHMSRERRFNAPSWRNTALEVGSVVEMGAHVASTRWLNRLPKGDGHPVIVYPGFMASDFSTAPLRRVLRKLGYEVHSWGRGRNIGPTSAVRAGPKDVAPGTTPISSDSEAPTMA